MHLDENLQKIQKAIIAAAQACHREPKEISILAVTKGQPLSKIQEAYDLGLRDFGENRIQEALTKIEHLPSDIRWHFIGKIQKNKVSKILGRFFLLHSIDSVELAEKISSASLQQGLRTQILLEANTSGEESKNGLTPQEWLSHFREINALEGIDIRGVMTMAPLTKNERIIKLCFSELKRLQEDLQKMDQKITTLSMGMSQDFCLAIQEGTTCVRLGTALFGYR